MVGFGNWMLGKGKQTTPTVVCLRFGAKFRGILDFRFDSSVD